MGKVADMVIDLTPFGYLVSVRNSVAGRTLVGNEELGPWERMLGFIPFVGTVHKVRKGLDVVNRTVSKIDNVTKPGSRLPNIKTDVPKSEFEKNLLNKGFTKTISGDGKTNIYTNEYKKYTTRDFSKSTGGPTADVYMNGKPISKIRLGDE